MTQRQRIETKLSANIRKQKALYNEMLDLRHQLKTLKGKGVWFSEELREFMTPTGPQMLKVKYRHEYIINSDGKEEERRTPIYIDGTKCTSMAERIRYYNLSSNELNDYFREETY